MACDYIRRAVSYTFARVGYHIGCHPLAYTIIPFLISLILSTGFKELELVKSIEYLFTPIHARSRTERNVVESLFPSDFSKDYDFLRTSRFGRYAAVIATAKYNDSMLDESTMHDLFKMDKTIRNISFIWRNTTISYERICAKTMHDECLRNYALSLRGKVKSIKLGKYKIKYPLEKTEGEPIPPLINLGGVFIDKNNLVRDFKAVRLIYQLDSGTEEKNQISSRWENEVLAKLSNLKFKYIKFSYVVGDTFDNEVNTISQKFWYLTLILGALMVCFSALSSCSRGVASKPLLGIAACLSAFISTASAFGLLLYCGMEYFDINMAIPFLMLGIGIDDSFVLLSAWRRTDSNDEVKKRMSDSYSEAAVSVSVTSITNILAFCTCLITPYRVVRIFGTYCAVSLVFDYIYQIFFFGGIMALEGYREKRNLHPLFLFPLKPIISDANERNSQELYIMAFLRDVAGKYLQKLYIKILLAVIYTCYLAGGIYCLKYIEQGLDYKKIFPYTSYAVPFTLDHYEYFTLHPHRIQIVINQTLDYSDVQTQKDVESLLNTFETAPFISGYLTTECWLREYLSFSESALSKLVFKGYNLNNSYEFVDGLKNVFLNVKSFRRFRKDIVFNTEGDRIVASRCYILSYNIKDSSAEMTMLETVRKIADDSKFKVFVHDPYFVYYDQYLNVTTTCIQTVCLSALLVSLVLFLFIPNFTCTICVMLTVVSIEVCIVGYMSLWNVNVDTISMIILVMSAGFCVDYSAHITYAYISSEESDPAGKMRYALYAAGYPIIQGCASTILGVSVLYFGSSYLFVIFFKILLLTMTFSAFHGLILLPVILSTGDSIALSWKNKRNRKNFSIIKHKDNDLTNNNDKRDVELSFIEK
ncbi:patched domain-containing protein 3-like [Centruroides sculpturatus]|uniref:patched domain-containing protein 3-like n=1 Tax=Centruroides sculpturatus TaxID=218467 RepID=UPI000C6D66E8|nr:patched domain-containing protein 3-like [Centruroides sculpturatus]